MQTPLPLHRLVRKAGACAALLFALSCFLSAARADDPALAGRWHFDETTGTIAADSSGNGNNGTASGTTFVTGQVNGAYNFNGGAALVNAGSGSTLDNPAGLTITAWIKPTGFGGGGGFGRIVDKTGYRLAFASSALNFGVQHAATELTRRTVTNVITLNAWQHVAVTWDGSSAAANAHIYVNGVEVSGYAVTTDGSGARTDDSGSDLIIGNVPTAIRGFAGAMDEVHVLTRALSAAEVQALVAAGSPNSVPAVTTATLPNGTVGTAYSQTLVATGGNGALVWSLDTGALPAGLTLSSGGQISGTPTAAGTSNFTVRVADSDALTDPADEGTRSFTLTIAAAAPNSVPDIVTTALPTGTPDIAYARALAASGGDGALVWSLDSGSLPAGLTLSFGGVISGTPTTTGTSLFTVRVADSDLVTGTDDEDTQALAITINPAAPAAVSASIVTNRTSGVAPLAVHFDASGTTDTTTIRPFHDVDYQWNFGDPSSGIWPVSGKSKNTDRGPLAGHVFETPGAYTVTLVARDAAGATDTRTVSITVMDPEVVFSGANTICISSSGNFTGAPAGAQLVTSSSWSTLVNSLGTGKRVLLRRGETWTHDGSTKNMTFSGPGILGAFGTGPRPVLKFASAGNGAFRLGTNSTPNQFTDFRFMDFEVNGNSVDRIFASAEGTIHNITFLRINTHEAAGFLGFGTQVLQFANSNGNPGHVIHTGIAMVDTDFNHMVFNGNINGVCFNQSMMLGNTMNDSLSGEHVLRIFHTQRLVFSHNALTNCAPGRHLLKLHAANVSGLVPASENKSQFIVISDNFFSTVEGNWPVGIGPQNDTTSEVVENVILDSNHLVFAGGTGLQVAYSLWGSEMTARNNTAVLTNPGTNGVVMFNVGPRGIEPPPHDNRIYNNSAYSASSTSSFFRMVSVSSSSANTTVRNNLMSAPNLANKSVLVGSGTNLQQSANLETNTPGWLSASPAGAFDFRLAAGSPAINGGSGVPVLADFGGTLRPLDSGWDIGAFEYNSASASAPAVAIAASLAAAGEPSSNGRFTVTASPAPVAPLTVNLSIGGTATSGVDFAALPATVVVGPGGSATIDVAVIDDAVAEPAETVVLAVLAGNGYTLGSPNAATVSIADNEVPNSVPSILTTGLPNAIIGVNYAQTLLGSGGDGALVWSIASGSLPAGLSLTPDGVISGTPTALGANSFTVRVADSDANSGPSDEASQALSLAVSPGDTVVSVAGGGFLNTAMPPQTEAFTASFDLTPSHSLMSANVGFSNGPKTAFSGLAVIIGTDASGGYFVARNGSAYTFTAPSIPYVGGQTYHFRVAVNLPLHTCSIFVTPPGGSELTLGSNFAFRTEQNTVTVLNNWVATAASPAGASITVSNFTITNGTAVNSVPSVTTTGLAAGPVNTAYVQTLAATGGDGALVWSLSAGGLPAGLSLSPAGVISGTPTTAGTSLFTVRVADSDANTGPADEDTQDLAITITTVSNVVLDANGWTHIAPSADSRLVHVSSSTGNDSNDGLTPATAKATIAAGDALIRDGHPDQLLLKRGDTFAAASLGRWKNGRSANEPLVLSSYGAFGARPVVRVAGSLIDHNGQVRNYQAIIGLDVYKPTSDPVAPEFNSSDCTTGLRFVGGGADILVEDCRLRFVNCSVQSFPAGTNVYTNFKFRRNIVTDNWVNNSYNDGNARVQGLFMSEVLGYLLEENVFDHNGWSEVVAGAGANQYNHDVYIQNDNGGGGIMRGNVFARGSAHGLQARSGGVVERNLFVLNAVSLNVGGVGTPTKPDVATFANRASQNVILEGRLMDPAGNTSSPRTSAVWGIWTAFIDRVLVDDNIIANRLGNGSNTAFNQQTGMTLLDNIVYQWDPTYNTNDPAWPHPADNLGDYYSSLGGADSTPLYLEWLRNRPLGELPWSQTAYAAINYVREGFNKGPVAGYFEYDGLQAGDTAPRITTDSLPDGLMGDGYQAFLSATGGNGPTVWSLASGSLPAGLTLSSAGAITGTPTAGGTFNFMVRVADSDANTGAGDEDTKSFTLTIAAVVNSTPTITTAWLQLGKEGVSYTMTLQGSAGDGALVWSLDSGSLPAGLTLSPAGVISGTPTAAGNFSLTVRVADSDVFTGPADESTRTYALAVVPSGGLLARQGGGYYNNAFPAQTGIFTATFDLIPSTAPMSANVGISNGATSAFSGMACIIGLDATGGFFVARNASAYVGASPAIPYVAGQTYHFRLEVNIPIHRYSIYVTPPGGAERTLGANFAFRPEQAAVSTLSNWVATVGGSIVGQSIGVFNFTVTPANTVPAIATTTLSGGTVDAAYAQSLVGTGGDGALVWNLDAGSLPAGLSLSSAGVISGTPTAAGIASFTVRLSDSDAITGPADEAVQEFMLSVNPAAASITLGNLTQVYDGTEKAISVSTNPAGLAITVTYDGNAAVPANAGSYAVVAAVVNPNYSGSANGTLVINKATAQITLGGLEQSYDGTPRSATITTSPSGLPVQLTYDGATTAPTNVGTYAVEAKVWDSNYLGSASGTLTVSPSTATITLGNLRHVYDGTPKSVTTSTTPAKLTVDVTYNDSSTAPTLPGTYAVTATINDSNYTGSTSGTLVISVTALVRHAPALNGDIDGSVQVLLGENTTLNGSSMISGDLLVPGVPAVRLNGQPHFGGTIDASGATTPADYTVTLNGNTLLYRVVRRVDPIALPTVVAPPAPAGAVNISLNDSTQGVGNWAALRNLTLNGHAGLIAVPPGTYGSFMANGSSGFILGVAGSTEPAVYNLQGLALNGGSQLQIVGPVVLTVAGGVDVNGSMGNPAHPEWLTIRLSSGGLTLNGNVTVSGTVLAPSGTITMNGNCILRGEVACDRLTFNGNGLLEQGTPAN